MVALSNNTATVVFRRPTSFTGSGFLISYIGVTPHETIDGRLLNLSLVTCNDEAVR